MTIAKRLLILLSVLLAALVIVGVFGISQMSDQSKRINYINTNIVPSLAVIDRIGTNFAVLRGDILRHMLSNNDQDMTKLEEDIKQVRSAIDADLKMYQEKLITSDKDRELLLDEQARIKEFYVVVDQVLPLSRNSQSALATEKTIIARPMIDAITKALKIHSEYNLMLADNEGSQAEEQTVRGGWVIAGILTIAFAIGLFLSSMTYRQVIGSLRNMQTTMIGIAAHLDFTQRVTITGQDEIADTARAFNALLDKVHNSLKTMRFSAERVSASSLQLSSAAQQVSVSSDEQSTASSNMAAAIEELAVSISHVSDRADEANTLVVHAGESAHGGVTVIEKTLNDIHRIELAIKRATEVFAKLDADSARVGAAVIVIRDIAEHADLLAQNAATKTEEAEGASRGENTMEDGIRKLAERTAVFTQEITETIAAMQINADRAIDDMLIAVTEVEKSVNHVKEVKKAIHQIESGAEQTVSVVGEITDAIREQNAASSIIAQQVERIVQMSEESSAAAQSTAMNSNELSSVAQAMWTEVGMYKVAA